jgi:hypothetical protein
MTMNNPTPAFLDGNAAAGALSEIFTFEVTTALGQCAGCKRSSRMAETHVYGAAPGVVMRCPGCQGVLLRYVNAGGQFWLDMRGLTYLHVENPL